MKTTWTMRAVAVVRAELAKTDQIQDGWKRVYALRRTLARLTTRDLMRPHPLPC